MTLGVTDVTALSALSPLSPLLATDIFPVFRIGSLTPLQYATLSSITAGVAGGFTIVAGAGLTGGTVANGGTIAISGYGTGTALDGLAGFGGTGIIQRTGAGAYSFTARLPFANLVQSTAPAVLVGAQTIGNFGQITLGSGLNMTGSTLSALASASLPPNKPMVEIDYAYHPSQLNKATAGAGVLAVLTGAGNGMADVQGGIWSVTTQLLSGVCDVTNGSQFLRDQLTFPAASTPAGLSQTIAFDLDPSGVATIYAMFRRASANTAYFVGAANGGANAGAAYIYAYNAGTQVASATAAAVGYAAGHTLRVTASVSGASPTTITCAVYDVQNDTILSTVTLSDSTAALQSASAGGITVTNNAGAAVAQTGVISQILAYDPTVCAKPNYCAFIGDSLTYGQQCSDGTTNGGTILGANPAAQAISNLGAGWGGANLGNQADRIDQIAAVVAPQLRLLSSGRFQQWAAAMVGINDIGQGATAATVEARLQTLCSAIRSAGFRVMLSTILPVGAGCTTYNSFGTTPGGMNAIQATVNTWIRANWQSIADGLVDPAGNVNLSSYNATYYYSADQLHLTDAGSAVVGMLYANALAASAPPSLSSVVLLSELSPSGVGTVTFSNIPPTFRDLRVVVRGAGTAAATFEPVRYQLNGDTGANYDFQANTFNNATSTSAASVAFTFVEVGFLPASTGVASAGGMSELTIYDYKGSVFNKSVFGRSGVRLGAGAGNCYATDTWGDWNNAAAVNSVTAFLAAGNFAAGSTVSLYGLL